MNSYPRYINLLPIIAMTGMPLDCNNKRMYLTAQRNRLRKKNPFSEWRSYRRLRGGPRSECKEQDKPIANCIKFLPLWNQIFHEQRSCKYPGQKIRRSESRALIFQIKIYSCYTKRQLQSDEYVLPQIDMWLCERECYIEIRCRQLCMYPEASVMSRNHSLSSFRL